MQMYKVFIYTQDPNGQQFIQDYTAYPEVDTPEEAVDKVLSWCHGYKDGWRITGAKAILESNIHDFRVEPIIRDEFRRIPE